ncbi:MAG TPA: (Fe-S)-binding protein, partial [bacterium]|nr:(Fe-S)-binding protein [bacterium]
SGQLDPDPALIDRLFQCTQCHDCARRCPSNAACPDIVLAARREMVRRGMTTETQNVLIENVQSTGNIYADPAVEFPIREGEVPLFIGCQYLSRPNSVKKIVKFLDRIGISPRIMEESCCGFPLHVMGFEQANQAQISAVRERFQSGGDRVLTLCPSCMKQLKEMYDQPSIHILELLDERLQDITVSSPLSKKVTYHDPCDLSRGAGITLEPRRILEHLGALLVEMPHHGETSRCCGGGGGILTWDADLSLRMSISRVREARETGAEMLVTACPTCEQNLKRGAVAESEETGHPPLAVRHLLDLMIRATR